ncbi:MAG TPA: hypothetical protein VHF25_15520 [Nitriliruptorales bacterium]|nr:hypothetical protein [Nitriliruptorales bacterium]
MEHDPTQNGLEASVDRVFADAVDRQLAEQRALNRLLAGTTTRLDGLESALRSLSEQHATATAALQALLREQLDRLSVRLGVVEERLADDPAARATALEGVSLRVEQAVAAGAEQLRALLDERLRRLAADTEAISLRRQQDADALSQQLDRIHRDVQARQDQLGATVMGHLDALLEAVETSTDQLAAVAAELQRTTARLEALPEELGAITGERLRAAVRAQADAAGDALRQALSELASVSDAVDDRTGEALSRLAGLSDAVDHRTAEALSRLAGLSDAMDDRMGEALSQLTRLSDAMQQRTVAAVEGTLTSAREEAARSGREVRAALQWLERLAASVERLDGALVAYLRQRDERLEEQRVQVLAELVERFAAGLSRRQQRKLAAQLDEAREVVEAQLAAAPTPPDTAPTMLTSIREQAHTGLLAALIDDVDGRLADEPDEPHIPPPVDPADYVPDVRVLLEGIRGLRAAPREEILARFSSPQDLRAATTEDLLAIRGVGPAIAARIRRALT